MRSSAFVAGLFLQRHRRCSQSAALALYKAALGGVGLHHHRELELVAFGGEHTGLLLPGQVAALDAQSLLQLADPPAHLEPTAGGQAQVGPVVGILQRVDPGAPEPGLQDLVPELLLVFKIHDVPRFLPFGSRNVPASPPKLHRAPYVIRSSFQSVHRRPPQYTHRVPMRFSQSVYTPGRTRWRLIGDNPANAAKLRVARIVARAERGAFHDSKKRPRSHNPPHAPRRSKRRAPSRGFGVAR